MIIYAYIIAQGIYHCCIKKFEDLSIFLASNNWFLLLKKVEKKFFALNKVAKLCQRIGKEELAEVTNCLPVRKYEFDVNFIDTQATGYWRKHIPNWTVIEVGFRKEVIVLRCDKIYKNALLITRCGLAYLNFMDACRESYDACA